MKKFLGILFCMALVLPILAGATGSTADRPTQYQDGKQIDVPVYIATTIYSGTMVCSNSYGYAVECTDAAPATTIFLGVAMQHVAAADAVASGTMTVTVRRSGWFKFKATGIDQTMIGAPMYIKYDNEFDNTSSYYVPCGRLVKVVSTTSGWIDISMAIFTGTTLAGSAVTIADAGNYYAAADTTAELTLQDLGKGPYIISFQVTGWTKDAALHALTGALTPDIELPVAAHLKRAYIFTATAPGSSKYLDVLWGDTSGTICQIAQTAKICENESLDIAVAANADLNDLLLFRETASGAGATAQVFLVFYRDDGE